MPLVGTELHMPAVGEQPAHHVAADVEARVAEGQTARRLGEVGGDGIEPGDELRRALRHLGHLGHLRRVGHRGTSCRTVPRPVTCPWPMTDGRMRVGVVLPIGEEDDGVPSYAAIREVALAVEAGGFGSVWVFDHLLYRFEGE